MQSSRASAYVCDPLVEPWGRTCSGQRPLGPRKLVFHSGVHPAHDSKAEGVSQSFTSEPSDSGGVNPLFMRIQIHSIHFDADAGLLSFVESKLEKLLTFNQDLQSCEVFLRVDKSDARDNKLVEVKAHLPGKDLFAKRRAVSFEAAMDEVSEALRRQVMKVHA